MPNIFMNIAIVAPSSVPFVVGGAEKFWKGLANGFCNHSSHFTELIKIPCKENNFWNLIQSYKTFSELDLSHFDLIISTKYPAWMVEHPNHIVYLQHTLRGLYDTYHLTNLPTSLSTCDKKLHALVSFLEKAPRHRSSIEELFSICFSYKGTSNENLPDFNLPSPLCRAVIHFLDSVAMAPTEIKKYAAISENVKNRTDYFPKGVPVKVLHHPSDLTEFINSEGEHLFTTSRAVNCKRMDLIIESMKYVTEDIPLLIAGDGPEIGRLKKLAEHDNRIKFLGYVSDNELTKLYSKAIAVPFVPRDEDYGLITIEAMMSSKPVITVEDAGGVCEFVENDKTGFCTPTDPKAFGEALQKVVADKARAKQLGENARKKVEHITWKNTVDSLLQLNSKDIKHKSQKIVVTTTFPIYPAASGGRKRIFNIFKELSEYFEVVFVVYDNMENAQFKEIKIKEGLKELRLPWNEKFLKVQKDLAKKSKASVDDIVAMMTCTDDELLLNVLKKETSTANIVVASHPYLYPAIKKCCPDIPLWYDAHNVEAVMKACVLEKYHDKKQYIDLVKKVEQECCANSSLITCCSQEDRHALLTAYGNADKVHIIMNGFDQDEINFTTNKTRLDNKQKLGITDIPTALFIGSLHQPNIEAVENIIKFSDNCPESVFLIAGTVCSHFQPDKIPNNVFLLNEVSEKTKEILLSSCDIGLNPITSGSGTNLKIVEYAAAGLEIVTTPFGLRGMESYFEKYITPYELTAFPGVINQICNNPVDNSVRKEQLRMHIESTLSWKSQVEKIQDLKHFTDK